MLICVYWNRKFQDMLQKLETCEQLLVRVKPQLAEDDQILIQKTLNSVHIHRLSVLSLKPMFSQLTFPPY